MSEAENRTAGEALFANARLVLPDRVVERGWLAVADGRIAELGEGEAPGRGRDLKGDTLVPGLVELHTDHLEVHALPRPGVRWPGLSAVLAYDAQVAAAGITTVYDCLRVGDDRDRRPVSAFSLELARALDAARASGALRVEHRTHLRCEICAADVLEGLDGLLAAHEAHLISLMDHTPGQRQFRDVGKYLLYYLGSEEMTPEGEALVAERQAVHAAIAGPHRRGIVERAKARGIVLASHDDATRAHVADSRADGVRIAEFPTTLEAAEASREAGIAVMMGAPNLVRGGSHSGNVSAAELARAGALDLFSSDYVPASLLLAAFRLPSLGVDLSSAVATVTDAPARAAGLSDRGRLEPGLHADLVRVRVADDGGRPLPVVRETYVEGRRVA